MQKVDKGMDVLFYFYTMAKVTMHINYLNNHFCKKTTHKKMYGGYFVSRLNEGVIALVSNDKIIFWIPTCLITFP